MDARHRTKGAAEAGMRLVKIGGPAYRIGMALTLSVKIETISALCTLYGPLSMWLDGAVSACARHLQPGILPSSTFFLRPAPHKYLYFSPLWF